MADKSFAAATSQPRFGQADLSSCEREQIHLARSIQPWGVLLLVHEIDQTIVQASANAAEFLGFDGSLIGISLSTLPGDLATRLVHHLLDRSEGMPVVIHCQIGSPAKRYNGLVHRSPTGGLIIEIERAEPPQALSQSLGVMLQTVLTATSPQRLCDEAARIFREVAGYDRVMVYQFDDEGHGQVVSEQREPGLEPYLGNRYPASDIPQIARRLYIRNRVRVLVDVGYEPVPLEPLLSPISGADLDMSLCSLRSVSPIHIQYLKNMGVRATLVVSLVIGGHLWGLVACHHYCPRLIPFETRATCDLLAETVATRMAALESFARGRAEISVRRLEQSMIAAITRKGDWRVALLESPQTILEPLGASGAALLFEDEVRTVGDVPGTLDLRGIAAWLTDRAQNTLLATASLGLDVPQFANLTSVASGMVAASLSESPGDYLLWFRPERVRTVTWGGDPCKSVVFGDNPLDLSPRRSFAQWHQIVEGTSDPWTETDLAAATQVMSSVRDVVLQFRAVRTIIAQDQLQQVRRQVGLAEQPVLIGDEHGRIVLVNDAFRHLIENQPEPKRILDLPDLFTKSDVIRGHLTDLMTNGQKWRGEVEVLNSSGSSIPLLLRADPVLARPGRTLGFVLMFTDLTERKAAAEARNRFQEDLIGSGRVLTGPLESQADLIFHNSISSIMENAQLAALEITDGLDSAQIPHMLQTVQTSARRAMEILGTLARHSDQSTGND